MGFQELIINRRSGMASETRVRVSIFAGSQRVEVTLGTQATRREVPGVMFATRFANLVHATLSTVSGWAKEDQ